MTVWRDGDRMYSRVKQAPITGLFPTSEHEYFQRAAGAIRFLPDAMILHESEATTVRRSVSLRPKARSRWQRRSPQDSDCESSELRPAVKRCCDVCSSSVAGGKPDFAAMTADQAKDVREELPDLRTTLGGSGAQGRSLPEGAGVRHRSLRPGVREGTADTVIELDGDGRLSGWWMQRR